MKIFKKNKTGEKRLRSAYALGRGTYATAITAIVIAAVILINILAGSLAERFPLNLDLSADGGNSLNAENAEYLRGITRDVDIFVCASENDISNGYYSQYASSYYSATDSTGKYFTRMRNLLKEYSRANGHIKITYVDASDPSAASLISDFSDYSVKYGDILVRCTFTLDGGEITRRKQIGFTDIYELTDESGYAAMGFGGYTISGSNLETVLTGAIYFVTSDKTYTLGVPAGYCDLSVAADFSDMLLSANYRIEEISGLSITQVPENLDGLLITAPSADFTPETVDAFDNFLKNSGKGGKLLIYLPSASSPALPNLEALLSEWGIVYTGGTLYETESANTLNDDPAFIGVEDKGSDYTSAVAELNVVYISKDNLAMDAAFTTYGDRTATVILESETSTVVRPEDAGDDWSPDKSTAKAYPVAIASADKSGENASYVLAFASVGFVNNQYVTNSKVGNFDLAAAVAGHCLGSDADSSRQWRKTVSNDDFSSSVTTANINIVRIFFIVIIPAAVIAAGVTVWRRRKNR